MSEREELASVIASKLDTFFGKREFGPAAQDYDLADALIELGYRKPRVITDPTELDALPVGSVVLSLEYKTPDGMRVAFQLWDDDLWHRGSRCGSTHPDNFLPATVLHEGAQS